MQYTKTEIDAGIFSDLLPEGTKFYMTPKLPVVNFKKDKVKYKVTDLRLLNEQGVHVVMTILDTLCDYKTNEVRFDIAEGTSEETIDLCSDIAFGFEWEAYKPGRNGYIISGKLVYGVRREGNELVFECPKENAETIYEYAHGKKTVSIYELVIAMAEKRRNDLSIA